MPVDSRPANREKRASFDYLVGGLNDVADLRFGYELRLKTKLGGLWEFWEGHLAHFRVFGVSAVGAVRSVMGRDGRPVRGPSGEAATVPAPEPCDEPDGPSFRYRPKNVTRPIVWLLAELMGLNQEARR